MKLCCSCKKLLPFDQFYRRLTRKDGLQSQCKKCSNERTRKHISTATHEKKFIMHIRHKYGLTKEQYDFMLTKQDGKCAICKLKGKLDIDHCHKTGKVRGLLCRLCNTALGGFKENIDNFKEAMLYLAEVSNAN